MPTQNGHPKKYGKKYCIRDLLPNHNLLIGMLRADTLCNMRNAQCALKELTEAPHFAFTKNAIASWGRSRLYSTPTHELHYEWVLHRANA